MKKILVLTVIALFVMMPFASFAKTAVSDSDLGAVTAQAGVTIDFDNLSVSGVTMSAQSWGDSDGFGSTFTSIGWYGAAMSLGGNVLGISGQMTIDIGTSGTGASSTRLRIAMPTILIGAGGGMNQDQTVKLSSVKTLTGSGELYQSYVQGLQATITGGLTIYAH